MPAPVGAQQYTPTFTAVAQGNNCGV